MRLIRLIIRRWPIWVIPSIVAALLAIRFTRNLPRQYSSSALLSVGLFESRPRVSASEEIRPDMFRVRAMVDLVQNGLKMRETVARAALYLFADDIDSQIKRLETSPDPAKGKIPVSALLEYVSKYGPVAMNPADLKRLSAVTRVWNLGHVIKLRDPDSLDDDVLAVLEDPRFPLSFTNVSKDLVTKREGDADLVRVEFKGTDPSIVFKFLTQLINNYVRNSESVRRDANKESLDFLSENVTQARDLLTSAENALHKFNDMHGISNYYEQAKYYADQESRMYMLVEEHKKKADGLQKALKELESLLGGNPRDAGASLPDSSLQDKLLVQRQQLARSQAELDLNESLGSIDPQQSAQQRARIAKLRSQQEKEMEKYWTSQFALLGAQRKDVIVDYYKMLVELDTEKAMAETAEKQLKIFQEKKDAFAPLGAELKKLERDVELSSGEYLDLMREANKTRMAAEIENKTSVVLVEQRPVYPVRPTSSKRPIMVMAAAIAPAIVGILFIVALAFFDGSLRTPSRVSTALGLPIAGGLPALKKRHAKLAETEGLAALPRFYQQAFSRVASMIGDLQPGQSVLIIPVGLGESGQIIIRLLMSLWKNKPGDSIITVGDDLTISPPALTILSRYARIIILWPMSLTPHFSDLQLIESIKAAPEQADVATVICNLDSDACQSFLGERPMLKDRLF
ncbi:MAG: hypothetical protein WCK47_00405 [bacterium]|nr:hypothetical protein [Candidatus Sumerlaeota bacterium]